VQVRQIEGIKTKWLQLPGQAICRACVNGSRTTVADMRCSAPDPTRSKTGEGQSRALARRQSTKAGLASASTFVLSGHVHERLKSARRFSTHIQVVNVGQVGDSAADMVTSASRKGNAGAAFRQNSVGEPGKQASSPLVRVRVHRTDEEFEDSQQRGQKP